MKKLFSELSDQILKECPEIVVVDLDRRQIDTYNQTMSIALPAVLLTISLPTTTDINRLEKMVELSIVARLAFNASSGETSSLTPDEWRNKALADLDLVDRLTAALQGFETDESEPLTWQSTIPEVRSDGLLVFNVRFSGSYYESFK